MRRRGEGGIICDEDTHHICERTRVRWRRDLERIGERLKGKYEVWKFGLGPSLSYMSGRRDKEEDGSSMSLLESSRREEEGGVIVCGCCKLRLFLRSTSSCLDDDRASS